MPAARLTRLDGLGHMLHHVALPAALAALERLPRAEAAGSERDGDVRVGPEVLELDPLPAGSGPLPCALFDRGRRRRRGGTSSSAMAALSMLLYLR